ncbi:hypothetical protein F5B18DRAFT_36027 [Nemania serpens]|nr:hypothetical protein F5B18DRAFT_36027 [Nemania serpens]
MSTSQPPPIVVEDGLLVFVVFDPDDSSGGDEDEAYLSDVPLSPNLNDMITRDLADEMQDLVNIALDKFFLVMSSPSWSVKGNRGGWFAERTGNRLRSSYFEVQGDVDWKHVEVEQKSDMDDDDEGIGSKTLATRHLACPFYLRDKDKYLSCLTCVDIRETKDLKRHLWTAHRQPTYCPVCYGIFTSTEDWEKHVRLGSCTPSGNGRPEGISVLQMQRLAQLSNPCVSRKFQWLLIWDIVFPGVRPPSLAFRFGEVETLVWMLQDFWLVEGDQIVYDFLIKRRRRSPQLEDDESKIIALRSLVLDRVTHQLVAGCRQDTSDGWCNRGATPRPPS